MTHRPGIALVALLPCLASAQGLPSFFNRSRHSWHLVTLQGKAPAFLSHQGRSGSPIIFQKLTLAPGTILTLRPGSALQLGLLPETKGMTSVRMGLQDCNFRNPWALEILLGVRWSPGDPGLLVNSLALATLPSLPGGPLWLHLHGLHLQGNDLTLLLDHYPGATAKEAPDEGPLPPKDGRRK